MNSLGILAALAAASLAAAAWLYRLQAAAERRRAEHLARLLTIAREQRDTARADRDKADEFAEEALMISGLADAIASHPASRSAAIAPALSIVRGQS